MTTETWHQKQNRARDLTRQREQGSNGGSFIARVNAVNAEADQMQVEWSGGSRSISILHPFLGIKAWHRVAPDPGMGLVMQQRMDTREVEGMAYHLPQSRNQGNEAAPVNPRLKAFADNKDVYRPIQVGEQDLSSGGLAQVYMGRRPIMDWRGGYSRGWLNGDSGESGTRAVLHRRVLHLNSGNAIGDEERFGVVVRPDDASGSQGGADAASSAASSTGSSATTAANAAGGTSDGSGGSSSSGSGSSSGGKSYVNVKYIKAPSSTSGGTSSTAFARERMFVLKSGSQSPTILIDHREGHVVDDEGEFVQGQFSNNLRFRKKLFSEDGSAAEFEVDEKGNIYVKLPDGATDGMKIQIPGGKFSLKSGSSSSELTMDGVNGAVELISSQSIKVDGTSDTKILGSTVKLGDDQEAIHQLLKTQIYKEAEKLVWQVVGTLETTEGTGSQTAGVGYSALSGIMGAIAAAPLCPGALVSLGNIAQNLIPIVLHNLLPQLKTVKSQGMDQFRNNYDQFLSDTVKNS